MAEKPPTQTVEIDTAGDKSSADSSTVSPTGQPMAAPPEAKGPDTSGLTIGASYASQQKIGGEPGTFVGVYTGARDSQGRCAMFGQLPNGRDIIRWAHPKACEPTASWTVT